MNIKIGHSELSKTSALALPISASKHGGQFIWNFPHLFERHQSNFRFWQNTYSPARNEQTLNLSNSSMKDIRTILRRQKLHLRSKTTTENWAVTVYDVSVSGLSLFMMRSFQFKVWIRHWLCFCAQTTLTRNVVSLACLVATTTLISINWRSTIPYHRLPDG